MSEKASRTVFVGNIPYGQSEEQIKEICGTVGQVLSFRPIYDNDTGRPRGYGFVEYSDADAAASAVRNLNGYKIEGRELRVDFSKRSDEDAGTSNQAQTSAAAQPGAASAGIPPNGIGPLPAGTELPPGVTCADSISKTLSTLPPPQLLDILSQMKGLVTGDPTKATDLLRAAPQLSYAIFQALLLMGLVDSAHIAQVVQAAATGGDLSALGLAGAGGGSAGGGAGGGMAGMASMAGLAAAMGGMAQQQPGQQFAHQHQQQQAYGQTPPVAQAPFQPPPQQFPPIAPGQEDLIKQVMSLPESELDRLDPAVRDQLLSLRRQYAGARF